MLRYFCLLILYLVTAVSELRAQSPQRFQKEFMALKNVILNNHFNAGKVDDRFSVCVYDKLLHKLDPDQLYFTAEDLKALSACKNTLDDEFNNGTLTFVPLLV